jgi:Tol biopolymer transport system component
MRSRWPALSVLMAAVFVQLSTPLASAQAPSPPVPSSTAQGAASESPTAESSAEAVGWIAYQTDRGAQGGIWLIRPDGTDDHEVATDVPGSHLHPDWSPDGTRLLFTSRGDKDLLYELDVTSGVSRPMWDCADPCVGDDEAVWSPDGSRIAFVRALLPIVADMPSDCSLWLGDPATGEVEQLTSTPGCSRRETFPHWSRDGSRISYYRGDYDTVSGEATATALYVLEVATKSESKLTDDAVFAGDSDWSAGDEWLVFTTHPLNDFQCCVVSDLWRIHPDGTGLTQLTSYDSVDRRATQPRYTPDGSAILFTDVTPSNRNLALLPADGGDATVITAGGIYTHGTLQPSE